jgi:hypothetical protein
VDQRFLRVRSGRFNAGRSMGVRPCRRFRPTPSRRPPGQGPVSGSFKLAAALDPFCRCSHPDLNVLRWWQPFVNHARSVSCPVHAILEIPVARPARAAGRVSRRGRARGRERQGQGQAEAGKGRSDRRAEPSSAGGQARTKVQAKLVARRVRWRRRKLEKASNPAGLGFVRIRCRAGPRVRSCSGAFGFSRCPGATAPGSMRDWKFYPISAELTTGNPADIRGAAQCSLA